MGKTVREMEALCRTLLPTPLTVMDSGVKGGSHHEKRIERGYMCLEIMRRREQVLVVKVNVHRATAITPVITAQTLPYPHGLTGGFPERNFRKFNALSSNSEMV